ncbi:enoyl-CoA hydratase/isomerase family protein [Dactylosporangium sp. AC04546]|uniref:enoyl-CoA hydratase/isomerase family protein n=1 Tax=Dactylosporangium sp. AC04546 TaxID=2862460 RepID=UPI0027E0FE60|nr:enoyl-CoA hydratase/isomerase family protein [Dactylosporangium sp. AC04546]WVK88023.1 enoyl-CoA hydratase/isomerase family protein [Dactylosporangium sp. AC04546]
MIELTEAGDVAVVRLAHGKVNALDLELLDAITDTFTALDAGDARAVVLTGAGRSFSAGVDLRRVIDGPPEYVDALLPALTRAFLAVFTTGKPVVAAVNGHAIAGGAVLVCACDHRLMAAGDARIGVTELLVGVPFPPAAMEIVRHAVGSYEEIMTGDTFEADLAPFVDTVVPPESLLDEAVATATRAARAVPPDTYRLTKEQLQAAVHDRLSRLGPQFDDRVATLWHRRRDDGTLATHLNRPRS